MLTKRRIWFPTTFVLLTAWLGIRWANSVVPPRVKPGLVAGRLADCGKSPNCVSTTAITTDRQLRPIPYAGSIDEARHTIELIIDAMPRARIVTSEGSHVHAEVRSVWLGFVDDVEFHVDSEAGQIHFRSASRVGYSDLGVNRTRMRGIVAKWLSYESN